jgi:hypothetical protein
MAKNSPKVSVQIFPKHVVLTPLGFNTDAPDNVFVMLKIRADRARQVAHLILMSYDKRGRMQSPYTKHDCSSIKKCGKGVIKECCGCNLFPAGDQFLESFGYTKNKRDGKLKKMEAKPCRR